MPEGDDAGVAFLRALIERELPEFSAELGAPVRLVEDPPADGPCFLIGPATLNPAFKRFEIEGIAASAVQLDRDRQVLTADGPDVGSVVESLSLLRTLTANDVDRVTADDCIDLNHCVDRVRREVESTYPSFSLRKLDWPLICDEHIPRVLSSDEPFFELQRWIARLQDMHTWVQPSPPFGLLPYAVHVDHDRAVFKRVPEWTAAFDAGIRDGDELLHADLEDAIDRTGAPIHMRPYLTGRRLVSGPAGIERHFHVRRLNGEETAFVDSPSFTPWETPATWDRLDGGAGYLQLSGFPPGINEIIETAFSELGGGGRLVVDLRGNTGGMLVEALDFRDRFLRSPGLMGTIQFSTPGKSLAEPAPIMAAPSERWTRWDGPVQFLTDPLTASASEDVILGLQGLPHIKTVGGRTGGGSGRARSIRLLPGMRLSVSTALTFDRDGRCVEGNGLAPDIPVNPFEQGFDSELFRQVERSC
jgi:carboxyl-terminal processing protease